MNVYTGEEARQKLMRGADAVADAVKLTYGAAGANAILGTHLNPGHRITNDGVSVAQAIFLEDPIENMGANIMKEIATRADKDSGDGTTGATILAQAILHEGMSVDIPPMQLKRELDECLPIIYDALDKQKKTITVDEVGKIATVSSEDEEMGTLLQEIYQQIGAEGIVEMDNSNLPTTFYEITEGVRIRSGFLGQYSCTEVGKAVYKNPKILVSREKITSVEQIEGLVTALSQAGHNELVIYCEEMDMSVAARLALTHLQGGFKTLVIQAPVLWKDWIYEDLPLLTGATAVDFANGKTFKNLSLNDLGTCEKIITTKDETRILGTKDITEHLDILREAAKTDDQQLVRIAWIQTKVAILKVGANSESELSYKRLKAIDAIGASHLALEDGVVAGGGVALAWATNYLPDTVGGQILRAALRAPMKQIIENAGGEKDPISQIPLSEAHEWGFNAKTGEMVNMWDAQILDPAKVIKNSVKSAISTAGTLLTTKVAVHMPKADLMERIKQELNPQYG